MGFLCNSELKLWDQNSDRRTRGFWAQYLVFVPSEIWGHLQSVEVWNTNFSPAGTLGLRLPEKCGIADLGAAWVCCVLPCYYFSDGLHQMCAVSVVLYFGVF